MRLIFTRQRKYRLEQIFDAVCMFLGLCFLALLAFAALSMDLEAAPAAARAEWFRFEIPYKHTPPAASACGGSVSVCQNNAASNSWQCYCVK